MRILITNDMLLNPLSGVKMFRYNGYNIDSFYKQILLRYKKELIKATKEIFKSKA